ncbi:MAG: VF530 family DNA-binding protein [Cellvibrionaceae bacterium]
MNNEINYKSNPLHGVSLKNLLTELVDHYGFEILFAYLNLNCFKNNPSIASSVKFLKKTSWACEKVEAFYLYEYKNLPRASDEQFELPPRDRVIPEGQTPSEPKELSLEDADRLNKKRAKKAEMRGQRTNKQSSSYKKRSTNNHKSKEATYNTDEDPWAKAKARLKEEE